MKERTWRPKREAAESEKVWMRYAPSIKRTGGGAEVLFAWIFTSEKNRYLEFILLTS